MKLKEFARKMAAVGLAVSVFGSLGISAFAETADEFETGVAEINTISVETSSAIEENGVFCWDLTASAEEIAAMSELIKLHGFGGNSVSVRPLLDAENQRKYLLAVSENGHLIAERGSYRFCQCGDGNPFAGYENYACYYGGPLCYFAAVELKSYGTDVFYDLVRNEYTDSVVTLARNGEEYDEFYKNGDGKDGNLAAVTLPHNYEYIRRRAFGYNDDNTCSAVATGIALSYIALKENMRLISDFHIPEETNGSTYSGKSEIISKYPHAHRLHRYIVNTAGMAPLSFSNAVDSHIEQYILLLKDEYPISECYQFETEFYFLPRSSTIRNEVSVGRPVLITTFSNSTDYEYHTMCVCGHRRINGEDELYIHSGWWGEDEFESDKKLTS